MDFHDDELKKFEAEGAAPLPGPNDRGSLQHEGARICYSSPARAYCTVNSVIGAIKSDRDLSSQQQSFQYGAEGQGREIAQSHNYYQAGRQ
jgi:hypothetical protein